jgi:hypothetical protein
MTEPTTRKEPDETRWYKGSALMKLRGDSFMLRESGDDPDSPWRSVAYTAHEGWRDPETGVFFTGVSVEFHSGGVRVINESDDVEVGLFTD